MTTIGEKTSAASIAPSNRAAEPSTFATPSYETAPHASSVSRTTTTEPVDQSVLPAVILVGKEAAALSSQLSALSSPTSTDASTPSLDRLLLADDFLEALLLAAKESSASVRLIIGSFGTESPQAEPIIRNLRRVYPHATLLLLCEPSEESLCLKAKRWGGEKKTIGGNVGWTPAVDYAILPIDWPRFRRTVELAFSFSLHAVALTPSAPKMNAPSTLAVPARSAQVPIAARQSMSSEPTAHDAVSIDREPRTAERMTPLSDEELSAVLSSEPPSGIAPDRSRTHVGERRDPELASVCSAGLTLPLEVQTQISEMLMAGREDLAGELVDVLQNGVTWNGSLRFWPALEGADAPPAIPTSSANGLEHRAAVTTVGHATFGTLSLVQDCATPDAGQALVEASRWLAAMLSLAKRYEQLRSLAITDELSGAYNRRYFMKFTSNLIERARFGRFRVSLLLFDIDDFKKYNDTFGHASGDAIIRELIKLLRSCTRPHDLVARLGGDEFAVVFWDNEAPRQPNSEHPKDAVAATERFRKAIQEHEWPRVCSIKGEVSISGGLATFPWDADTLEGLMERADRALLRAKTTGKNVILFHSGGQNAPADSPCPETTEPQAHTL